MDMLKKYADPIVNELFLLVQEEICSMLNKEDKILDIGCGTGR